MLPVKRSRLTSYSLTVLYVAMAALASGGLNLWLHIQAPLSPFSIAVMASAWVGGLEAGLFGTAMSAVILFGVYRGNMFTLLAIQPGIPLLIAFCVLGVLISFTVGRAARGYAEAQATRAELQQTMERLSDTNQASEQFADSAADALRTPLRAISVFAELLEVRHAALLDNESKEYLRIILNSTRQMHEVIDGLRAYAHARKPQPALLLIDSNAVLRQAIQHLRAEISAAGAMVSFDDLPTVRADEGGLLQVMQSLLSNSLKYRSEVVPHIHVSARREEGEWIFSLSDNGIGMNENEAEEVFDLFRRVDRNGSRGSGIGLAICRATLERYGGRIWLESAIGTGSTFYFALPAGTARLARKASV